MSSFEEFELDEKLLRGIYSYGFENPSEIQLKAIPIIKSGKDVIAQSKSGTGKTGAFSIGAIASLEDIEGTQILIICPTYELVHQTYDLIQNITNYMDKVSIMKVIGGTNVKECQYELQKCPSIIIGTPGRILDMIDKRYLYTDKINRFIIDEADEMLSSGFKEVMYNIFRSIPKESQISLFSATLPDDILKLTECFMNEPEKILLEKDNITLEGIKQYYVNVNYDNYKVDTFVDIYNKLNVGQCIIYINNKNRLKILCDDLRERDLPVNIISGDLSMEERKAIINEFKLGNIRILISTDLLSRGLDVQQLSLVINLELPINKESYIHRIGRSGRYGRKGTAINILNNKECSNLSEISTFYNTTIDELPSDLSSIDL